MHQRTTIAAALTAALALSTTVFAAPVTTEGTATGRHGDLTVAVTFDGGKIRKIDIVKESENPILGTSSPGPFLRGSTTKNLFLS